MGRWLRKIRLQRGHTQSDVGAAIGRNFRFVSDVELGHRGLRLDPVIALLWCEYLIANPDTLFGYMGLGETDMQRFRVQDYLRTGAWAHRFTEGRRRLIEAHADAEKLLGDLRSGTPAKLQAYRIRDSIKAALEAIHIPEKKEG